MNQDRFDKVVAQQKSVCDRILTHRQDVYATSDDRLHNFKQSARLQNITQRQALGGHLSKHIISIYDLIARHAQGDETTNDVALWEEKITDAINYLFLLKAIVEEEAHAKHE